MSRADYRRKNREEQKKKTATYNLTREQMDNMMRETFELMYRDELNAFKQEVYEETVNDMLALLLCLPMKVLKEHYWPKSYDKKLPEFINRVLYLYSQWQDDELDIEELKKELWESVGIRLEGCKIEEDYQNEQQE